MGLSTTGGVNGRLNNQMMLGMGGPAMVAQDKTGQADIDANSKGLADVQTNARNLRMLGQAINSLPTGGWGAMGADFHARQQVLQAVQTVRRIAGLGDDESLNKDMTPADIMAKINALGATNIAAIAGQHSADMAHTLMSILPGGNSSTPEAANHIVASLMVQNQQQLDFGNYAQAYVNKYGTAAGVRQAFNDEVAGNYGQEQSTLERMMPRKGRAYSIAEYLQQHPERLKDFEMGTHGAQGLGTGIGRYFPPGV